MSRSRNRGTAPKDGAGSSTSAAAAASGGERSPAGKESRPMAAASAPA